MAKPKNDAGHSVLQVEINGPQVKVICSCGWRSRAAKDEAAARSQHDVHCGAK